MVGVVLGDWSSGVVMLSDWLGHEEYIKGVCIFCVLCVFLFTWLISFNTFPNLSKPFNIFPNLSTSFDIFQYLSVKTSLSRANKNSFNIFQTNLNSFK